MEDDFGVLVSAGSLRNPADPLHLAHRWTADGVTADASFTGGHLLHLSVAGCVLNDIYREAGRMGIEIHGVRVRASGGFDDSTWASTGIAYTVELDASVDDEKRAELLRRVDRVAEIPRAVRAGADVRRVDRVSS